MNTVTVVGQVDDTTTITIRPGQRSVALTGPAGGLTLYFATEPDLRRLHGTLGALLPPARTDHGPHGVTIPDRSS